MQRIARSTRGGLTPAMMFLIASIVILAGVGIWFMTNAREKEKKQEQLGKVGAVTNFTLDRESGMNLPFADQAAAGPAAPQTTIEIPLEWGKDTATAQAKIAERYDEIEKGLTKSGELYDERITLKADRDLRYRTLYQAVAEGEKRGFLKLDIACYATPESNEVRYLHLDPPTEFQAGKNALLFRVFRDGDTWQYALGVSKVRKYPTLASVAKALKSSKIDESKFLVLGAELDMSVQNVAEALNVGVYGGFKRMTLNRTSVE